jgi:hypothetical protein
MVYVHRKGKTRKIEDINQLIPKLQVTKRHDQQHHLLSFFAEF